MKRDDEPGLRPSILDRLVDDDPQATHEPPNAHFQDVRELKSSVARDLEDLLNSRQDQVSRVPAEFTEVRRSLLAYGLPDFASFNLANPADRSRVQHALQSAIAAFEPRLQRVRVLMENPTPNERTLCFKVEALLQVEPAPEPVVFDTVLQLGTQEYVVKKPG